MDLENWALVVVWLVGVGCGSCGRWSWKKLATLVLGEAVLDYGGNCLVVWIFGVVVCRF